MSPPRPIGNADHPGSRSRLLALPGSSENARRRGAVRDMGGRESRWMGREGRGDGEGLPWWGRWGQGAGDQGCTARFLFAYVLNLSSFQIFSRYSRGRRKEKAELILHALISRETLESRRGRPGLLARPGQAGSTCASSSSRRRYTGHGQSRPDVILPDQRCRAQAYTSQRHIDRFDKLVHPQSDKQLAQLPSAQLLAGSSAITPFTLRALHQDP